MTSPVDTTLLIASNIPRIFGPTLVVDKLGALFIPILTFCIIIALYMSHLKVIAGKQSEVDWLEIMGFGAILVLSWAFYDDIFRFIVSIPRMIEKTVFDTFEYENVLNAMFPEQRVKNRILSIIGGFHPYVLLEWLVITFGRLVLLLVSEGRFYALTFFYCIGHIVLPLTIIPWFRDKFKMFYLTLLQVAMWPLVGMLVISISRHIFTILKVEAMLELNIVFPLEIIAFLIIHTIFIAAIPTLSAYLWGGFSLGGIVGIGSIFGAALLTTASFKKMTSGLKMVLPRGRK